MHDGTVIVSPHIISVGNALGEIVLRPRLDLIPVDGDEAVTVLTAVLMPQSNRMADLVDRIAR